MPLNMRLEPTSVTSVPDDVATELQEAWDTLSKQPVNKMLTTDPFTPDGYKGPAKQGGKPVTDEQKSAANARLFVRQAKSWAASQTGPKGRPLVFARKGDVKGNPVVVSFRIYEQREVTANGESPAS